MDKRDKETIMNKKRRKNMEQNTYSNSSWMVATSFQVSIERDLFVICIFAYVCMKYDQNVLVYTVYLTASAHIVAASY